MAKDGEDGLVAADVDGVIAPFAGGDLATVNGEDGTELVAAEGREARRCAPRLGCARAPRKLPALGGLKVIGSASLNGASLVTAGS